MSRILLVILILAGCTSIGIPIREPAPHPYVSVTVCVRGPEEAGTLERAWPGLHGVLLVRQCPGQWTVNFVERPWWYALVFSVVPAPEALGWADGVSSIIVFTGVPSVNGLLMPPHLVLRHEIYHLLGCNHVLTRGACYQAVQTFKGTKG